jgi:hypothetical protein
VGNKLSEEDLMCCLFAALILLGPRVGGALWWIFQPARWVGELSAFESFLWPLIGLILLPWTTIIYVSVFPAGLSFLEWAFIILALIVDIGSYTGSAYSGRNRFSTT